MIKIQIGAGKEILREYSLKDRSLLGKDRVLALCNNFFKEFWASDTLDLQDSIFERQGLILLSQNDFSNGPKDFLG